MTKKSYFLSADFQANPNDISWQKVAFFSHSKLCTISYLERPLVTLCLLIMFSSLAIKLINQDFCMYIQTDDVSKKLMETARKFKSILVQYAHYLSLYLVFCTALCQYIHGTQPILSEISKKNWRAKQRYTYRVLQTIQMKLILLCVWAEPAVLGSTKTALNFIYKI